MFTLDSVVDVIIVGVFGIVGGFDVVEFTVVVLVLLFRQLLAI